MERETGNHPKILVPWSCSPNSSYFPFPQKIKSLLKQVFDPVLLQINFSRSLDSEKSFWNSTVNHFQNKVSVTVQKPLWNSNIYFCHEVTVLKKIQKWQIKLYKWIKLYPENFLLICCLVCLCCSRRLRPTSARVSRFESSTCM